MRHARQVYPPDLTDSATYETTAAATSPTMRVNFGLAPAFGERRALVERAGAGRIDAGAGFAQHQRAHAAGSRCMNPSACVAAAATVTKV